MAGFDNEVIYADNVDFSGAFPVEPRVLADGQLLIGSTATPNIKVGTLASSNGTITITNGSGTIDLVASATGVAQTLTGNAGVATPAAGNINVVTANTTVRFVGAADDLTQDFDLTNLIQGSPGTFIAGGIANVGYGSSALRDVSTGSTNTAVGYQAGRDISTSVGNTALGSTALAFASLSSSNTGIGLDSLGNLAFGLGANTAVGLSSLLNIQSGNNNIALGVNAGNNHTLADSNNIVIGNLGATGESNTIRIGTTGSGTAQQNRIFLAAVTGVTVAGSAPIGVDTNGQLSSLGFGTAAQVFTSNGPATSPTWQAASASGAITTLTGNTGGALTPTAGNMNIQTSNSTVVFAGSGSTLTQNFNLTNLILGSSIPSLAGGTANTGIGSNVLNALTSGVSNTCAGFGAGDNINSGNENTCYGRNSGGILTVGGQNVCVGLSAGASLTGGSSNVFIGRNTGNSFSNSVNNNICIGDQVTGSGAVSNSIRIGGTHTTCFIDGIESVTVAASAPVGVNSSDQLSSLGFGTAGQLFVSGGAGVSPAFASSAAADFSFTSSTAGGTRSLTVSNTDNTNSATTAVAIVSVGGTSAGDAYDRYVVGSTRSYAVGIDNSDTQAFVINTATAANATPSTGNQLMKITGGGNRTLPLNSCFSADVFNSVTNTTGDGTEYFIIFDNEASPFFDQNANYDTTTGVFTAPVAGKYQVNAKVTMNNLAAAHNQAYLTVKVGGTNYSSNRINPGACRDAGNMLTMQISFVVALAASATVAVALLVSGGTKVVGIEGANFSSYSNFSACLVS